MLGYNCRITVSLTLGDIAGRTATSPPMGNWQTSCANPFIHFPHWRCARRAPCCPAISTLPKSWHRRSLRSSDTKRTRDACSTCSTFVCATSKGGVSGLRRCCGPLRHDVRRSLGFTPRRRRFYVEIEREAEARSEFEQVAGNDFRDLPCDIMRLTTLAYLARACAFLGDRRRGELLYRLLAPHAGLHVAALSFSYLGSVAHYLGLLAAMLERDDDGRAALPISAGDGDADRRWTGGRADAARLRRAALATQPAV